MAQGSSIEDILVRFLGDASSYFDTIGRVQQETLNATAAVEAAASRMSSGISGRLTAAGTSLQQLGGQLQDFGGQLNSMVTEPLKDMATEAVTAFANFESQIVKTFSLIRNIEPGGPEEKALEEEALRLGATTMFTAAQAAEGMTIFARAGKRPGEIIQAMQPVLQVAAIEMISLEQSASAVSDVMAGMQIPAAGLGHALDVLATASTASRTSVTDLAMGIRWAGPSARSLGLPLEDLTATLEVLAEAGIPGAQAGRGLRTVFTRLAKPTAEARQWFDKMGVSVFDQAGKFVGMQEVINRLSPAMANLTDQQRLQAAASIAGVHQSSVFMNLIELGGEKFAEFREQLNDVGGTIDKMFVRQMGTLRNQWLIFKSAIEGAQIELVRYFLPTIVSVINTFNEWVASWRTVDREVKVVIVSILAFAAAIGPALLLLGGIIKLQGLFLVGLGGLTAAFGTLVGGLLYILNPLNLVIGLFGALLGAVRLLATFIIVAPIGPMLAGIVLITRNWDTVVEGARAAWEQVVGFIEGAFLIARVIVQNFGEIVDEVVSWIVRTWAMVDEALDPMVKKLIMVWELLVANLKPAFEAFLSTLFFGFTLVIGVLMEVFNVLSSTVGAIGGWFAELTAGMRSTNQEAMSLAETAKMVAQGLGVVAGAVVVAYVSFKVLALATGLVSTILTLLNVKLILTTAAMVIFKAAVLLTKVVMWGFILSMIAFKAVLLVAQAIIWLVTFAILTFKGTSILATAMTWLFGASTGALSLAMNIAALAIGTATVAAVTFGLALVAIPVIISTVVGVVAAVGALIAAPFVAAFMAIKSVGGALLEMGNIASGPVSAIGNMLGSWGDMLGNVVRAARVDMPLAWDMLKASAQLAINQVKDLFPPLGVFIQDVFAAVWKAIREIFLANMRYALNKFATELEKVSPARFLPWTKSADELDQELREAERTLKRIEQGQGTILGGEIGQAKARFGVKFKVSPETEEASRKLKELTDKLGMTEQVAAIKGVGQGLWKGIGGEGVTGFFGDIWNFGKDVGNQLGKKDPKLDKLAKDAGDNLAKNFNEGFKGQIDKIEAILAGSAEAIARTNAYKELLESLRVTTDKKAPEAAADAIGAPNLPNAGGLDLGARLGQGVAAGLNWLGDAQAAAKAAGVAEAQKPPPVPPPPPLPPLKGPEILPPLPQMPEQPFMPGWQPKPEDVPMPEIPKIPEPPVPRWEDRLPMPDLPADNLPIPGPPGAPFGGAPRAPGAPGIPGQPGLPQDRGAEQIGLLGLIADLLKKIEGKKEEEGIKILPAGFGGK